MEVTGKRPCYHVHVSRSRNLSKVPTKGLCGPNSDTDTGTLCGPERPRERALCSAAFLTRVRRCCAPFPPFNAESECVGRPGDMGVGRAHRDHRSSLPSTYHVSMSLSGLCTVLPVAYDAVKVRA